MVGMMHQEKLNGRIDRTCAEALQQRLHSAMAVCGGVELDLSNVTYVSSAGFRVLMQLDREGDLSVIHACPAVSELFDAVGLSHLIRREGVAERLTGMFSRRARRCLAALPVRHRVAWQAEA